MVSLARRIMEIEPVLLGRSSRPECRVHTHFFFCPGCNYVHCFSAKLQGYDRNAEKPTLQKEVYIPGQIALHTCRGKITGGMIRYTNDSTHHLKGETVELPIIQYGHI